MDGACGRLGLESFPIQCSNEVFIVLDQIPMSVFGLVEFVVGNVARTLTNNKTKVYLSVEIVFNL
jgi:hypothetical protein